MADPSSLPRTSEWVEKKYYILATRFEYLYSHPPMGSLVVSAANDRDRQRKPSDTSKNKEAKRLDLFGRKVYYMGSLQLRISNQQVLLGGMILTCGTR